MDEKTTSQVAVQLSTNRKTINMFLSRHPELRPVKRLQPSGDLLWTEEEIQRLIERRDNPSKRGRPRKTKTE